MTKPRIPNVAFEYNGKFNQDASSKIHVYEQPKDVSDLIGSFGLWQKLIWLSVLYFEFLSAIINLSCPLLVPDVPFKCDMNQTELPRLVQDNGVVVEGPSQCMFTVHTKKETTSVPCQKWTYSHEEYKYTFTEEWDLVCEKGWLLSFSNTVTILGDLIACSAFGYMSDRFGRQRTLVFLILPVASGILVSLLSRNVFTFLFGRFLLGAAGHGGLIVSFILMMETVGVEHRPTVGIYVKLGFPTGGLLLGIAAYFLRDTFQILKALSVACILLIPIALLLPESPRWLMVSGLEDGLNKAKTILKKAAKYNRVQCPDLDEKLNFLSVRSMQERQNVNRKYSFMDLVRMPNLKRKTLIITILWGINSFCYYGITLMSTRLGTDPLITFIIILAIEFPVYFLIKPAAQIKGYKTCLVAGFLLNSIVFITSSQARIESGWKVILVILLAKVGSTVCGACVGNYATEIFPTVVRSLGLGTCAIVSRTFVLLSPFLKELGEATSLSTVFGLLAVLSLTCSALVLCLPDSHKKPFPETLEESEKTGLTRPWKTMHISRKLSYFKLLR